MSITALCDPYLRKIMECDKADYLTNYVFSSHQCCGRPKPYNWTKLGELVKSIKSVPTEEETLLFFLSKTLLQLGEGVDKSIISASLGTTNVWLMS